MCRRIGSCHPACMEFFGPHHVFSGRGSALWLCPRRPMGGGRVPAPLLRLAGGRCFAVRTSSRPSTETPCFRAWIGEGTPFTVAAKIGRLMSVQPAIPVGTAPWRLHRNLILLVGRDAALTKRFCYSVCLQECVGWLAYKSQNFLVECYIYSVFDKEKFTDQILELQQLITLQNSLQENKSLNSCKHAIK